MVMALQSSVHLYVIVLIINMPYIWTHVFWLGQIFTVQLVVANWNIMTNRLFAVYGITVVLGRIAPVTGCRVALEY